MSSVLSTPHVRLHRRGSEAQKQDEAGTPRLCSLVAVNLAVKRPTCPQRQRSLWPSCVKAVSVGWFPVARAARLPD